MKEEYLNQAANDYCRVNLYDGKYCRQDVYEAFQDGMKHAMELPLADRLSESEKEEIKKEYKKAYSEAFAETTCLDRQYARGRYQALREIFGSNLFTPTEQ